jgi:hypothetical protein
VSEQELHPAIQTQQDIKDAGMVREDLRMRGVLHLDEEGLPTLPHKCLPACVCVRARVCVCACVFWGGGGVECGRVGWPVCGG